jgi:hypothetical protein
MKKNTFIPKKHYEYFNLNKEIIKPYIMRNIFFVLCSI